jgi:hypothetical protein
MKKCENYQHGTNDLFALAAMDADLQYLTKLQ